MVKHAQIIRRLLPSNFMELAIKEIMFFLKKSHLKFIHDSIPFYLQSGRLLIDLTIITGPVGFQYVNLRSKSLVENTRLKIENT